MYHYSWGKIQLLLNNTNRSFVLSLCAHNVAAPGISEFVLSHMFPFSFCTCPNSVPETITYKSSQTMGESLHCARPQAHPLKTPLELELLNPEKKKSNAS